MMFHTGVAVITYNLLMREIPPGVRDLGSPMITRVTSAVRMLPGRAGVFIAVTGFFSLQMEVLVGKSRDFFSKPCYWRVPLLSLALNLSADNVGPRYLWMILRWFGSA